MHASNALKADLDVKRRKKQELIEQLEMIKKIAKQDQAFETVYEAIEDEFGEKNQEEVTLVCHMSESS